MRGLCLAISLVICGKGRILYLLVSLRFVGNRRDAYHDGKESRLAESDSEPGYPGPDESGMRGLGLCSNSVAKQVAGTAPKMRGDFTLGSPDCQAEARSTVRKIL